MLNVGVRDSHAAKMETVAEESDKRNVMLLKRCEQLEQKVHRSCCLLGLALSHTVTTTCLVQLVELQQQQHIKELDQKTSAEIASIVRVWRLVHVVRVRHTACAALVGTE